MTLRQAWASLYMAFFNMPKVPEWLFGLGKAWVVGLVLNSAVARCEKRWIDLYRTAALQPGACRAMFDYYRAAVQLDPKPRSENKLSPERKMQLPVLLLRGKQDEFLLADIFAGWEKYFAKAELVELDDCSHFMMGDKPEAINKAIEGLLSRL